MRTLFLNAANNQLYIEHRFAPVQDDAIDILGRFIHIPKIQATLVEIFDKISYDKAKAACIRALCPANKKPLISYDQIFAACMDASREVRTEARRVLRSITSNL